MATVSTLAAHETYMKRNNLMFRAYAAYDFVSGDSQTLKEHWHQFVTTGLYHCCILVAILEGLTGWSSTRFTRARSTLIRHMRILHASGPEASAEALDEHLGLIEEFIKLERKVQDYGEDATPEILREMSGTMPPVQNVAGVEPGDRAVLVSALYMSRLCYHFRWLPPKEASVLTVLDKMYHRNNQITAYIYGRAFRRLRRSKQRAATRSKPAKEENKET
ncbi:hypothetical protein S40285_09995 [Stachybotrys chlorohalonatus IBT 40285]|uniref:Uncharacterized protein n=1 Tax=Stachybotrys chlorohalonatus (strain IBT 40285) TaxID=1283841 RepID=A0A084R0V8_STAC4|nr:hypothetical protein S40285_09995 [Stachybotrys chlorohalonata IBT 40285]